MMKRPHLDELVQQIDFHVRIHGLENVMRILGEACLERADHGPVDEEMAERWATVGIGIGYLAADCEGLK